MQSVTVEPGPYGISESISTSVLVKNVGQETSLAYNIDFYRSNDASVDDSDVYLGTLSNRPPLDVGGTVALGVKLGIFPEGDWWIGAFITLIDADTSNNGDSTANAVTVSTAPEILVSPTGMSFVEPPAGETANSAASPAEAAPQEILQSSAELDSTLRKLEPQFSKRGHARVLVGLDVAHRAYGGLDRASRQAQQDAIRTAQDAVIAQLPNNAGVRVNARFKTIPYLGLTVDRRALQALLNAPSVRSVEEDSLSWPVMDSSNGVIGAPVAWSEGFDGSGWAVAVLDSGVDLDHAWFNTGGDKIVAEACYSSDNGTDILSLCPPDGNNTVTESTAEGSAEDCPLSVTGCGHGTHVAGTVAGNDGGGTDLVGVAPGADIIAMNVFTKFTDPGDCGTRPAPCIKAFVSDQIKGLEQVLALSAGMDIAAANMSLGGGRYYDQASCDAANGARKLAIDNLRSVGIATVIAAGNSRTTILAKIPEKVPNQPYSQSSIHRKGRQN